MEAEYNWKSVFLLALRWKWIPFPLRVRWRRATVQSLMSSSVRSCGGEPRVRRGEEPRTGGLCGEDRRRRDACGSWLWRTCPRRPVRVGGGERARGVGDGVISLTELDGLRRRGRGTLTTERTRLRRGGGLVCQVALHCNGTNYNFKLSSKKSNSEPVCVSWSQISSRTFIVSIQSSSLIPVFSFSSVSSSEKDSDLFYTSEFPHVVCSVSHV